MIKPLIQIKDLSKQFNDIYVFRGIDISIYQGQSLAIIGGSGQGKSVLLKCIIGLMPYDSGQILYKGSILNKTNKNKFINGLGVVFQGAALFDSLPIWENITFKFKYSRTHSCKERRKIAIQKLDLVELSKSCLDSYPSELSGGMQKRVGIARAIATEPKILFFDEPTSGLDPITSNTINNLIRFIIKELGSTAITISHDLNSIRTIADDIVLLHKRKIEWSGSIDTFEKTKNINIREFIKPNLR